MAEVKQPIPNPSFVKCGNGCWKLTTMRKTEEGFQVVLGAQKSPTCLKCQDCKNIAGVVNVKNYNDAIRLVYTSVLFGRLHSEFTA